MIIIMPFLIVSHSILLEKFWPNSLYVTEDVKFSQIEGNCRKFRHIELSNSVISKFF